MLICADERRQNGDFHMKNSQENGTQDTHEMQNTQDLQKFLPVIHTSQLFSGISDEELLVMLKCLGARKESFAKGEFLLRAGDSVDSISLVLSGNVLIIQEDIWGNRHILAKAGSGQSFGSALACAPGTVSSSAVSAETAVTVLRMNVKRVLNICSAACAHHNAIIRNLLGELASKNLASTAKLTHMGQRGTRAKLLSYFSSEVKRNGSYEFDIPFSRQQLADYLAVDRSGLSLELGKMKGEGLLEFNKNHFKIKI